MAGVEMEVSFVRFNITPGIPVIQNDFLPNSSIPCVCQPEELIKNRHNFLSAESRFVRSLATYHIRMHTRQMIRHFVFPRERAFSSRFAPLT